MTDTRAELEERRDLALRDLAELEEQLRAGDVDAAAAAELRTRYEQEAAAALRALRRLDAGSSPAMADRDERRGRRWVVPAVASLAVAAVAVAAVALPGFVGQRPAGGFVTGNEVADGRDLSQVTNEEMEQVVAANPDIVEMRLRLAHRYLDEGDHGKAFDHYMAVLDRQPHPEAMSHLGWVVFQQGDVELALRLLEESRQRDPVHPETMWFLANVHLYGRGDAAAALPLLEQLLQRTDLGDQRAHMQDVLDEARRRTEAP